jgi:hypothetical protein
LNQVVWCTVKFHASCYGGEIAIDLGVAKPEDGEPEEDEARLDGPRYLIDELIVPEKFLGPSLVGIVCWMSYKTLFKWQMKRRTVHCIIPEIWSFESAISLHRVE